VGWTSRFQKSTALLAWRRFSLGFESTAYDFGLHSKVAGVMHASRAVVRVIVASKRNTSSAW
jgi:hypothetical protein